MRGITRRAFSLLLVLSILISLLSGLTIQAHATTVDYVTGSNGYIYNWGTRGTTATFLSPNAEDFYEYNQVTYDDLAVLSGASTVSAVPSSALYLELQELMSSNHSYITSYAATRDMYQYTDCQVSGSWNSGKISSFYSGTAIGPAWDGGSTWNREHTWPDSKGDASGSGEDDIMMLRPASVSENSSRGNKAYGVSSGYYHPNSESDGVYDLRGDCARIMLYVYVRWGNTGSMWGSSGVMESKDVLLTWMEEDPVDTWELGRNDSVESITGTRNVFVDYPELAFLLFNEPVPGEMTTPSGEAASHNYTITAISSDEEHGTVYVDGMKIIAEPKPGYAVDGYAVCSGSAKVEQIGNTFTVTPNSDCTIEIRFVETALCTVTFAENGTLTGTEVVYTGDTITLPENTLTVEGYTFAGWSAAQVEDTKTAPVFYEAGTSYTVTGDTTLYALYTYSAAGTGSAFVQVTAAPASWEGEYVLTSTVASSGVSYAFLADGTTPNTTAAAVTYEAAGLYQSGTTLKGVADSYVVIVEKVGSYYSMRLKGADSTLYLMTTNSNSGFNTVTSTSANTALWSFAFTDGTVVIKNAAFTSRTLRFNASSKQFRTYESGQNALTLYSRSLAAAETYYTTLGTAACTHENTTTNTVAATCTAAGSVTVTCNDCQSIVSTESIAALGHSYESAVTAPTCATGGYTTYTCTCGDSYVDDYVDALNHDYLVKVTYPAGTTKGYTDYICSRCADSYRTPWLIETAYEGMTIACVGDSITAAYGVTKDETDYVTLLAEQLGMEYIRLGVSGTTLCTDGSRTCNIGKLTEANLQGADVVTIAMGINDFCNAAEGYYELGDINSTDTSTIYGAVRMWCERIAELRQTDSLSDTQFYFVTPTISSWNNSVSSVRDWDQSKTNIHGYTLRDLCNAIMEVAALYDVAVIDLNLLSGMYYVDAEDNNTVEFGGDGVHPGEVGHAMMAGALTNILLQNDLRDDHAHIFGSWITTTWPSCVAGTEQRVCSVCSATESCALEPNGIHRYVAVITAPTCTEVGYTTYTCSICGDSYTADETAALGHTYVDGICSGCGEQDPDYVKLIDFAGMTMSLGNSLAVNFVLNTALLDGTDHYAVITKEYADGTEASSVTVPQSQWQVYSGSLYYFTFAGVKAKEMTDDFTVVVYNADGEQVSVAYTRTIEDYCRGQITKYEQEANYDAERLALYVDILKYGAAAQDYFEDYNIENLATANLTDAQLAYGTDRVEMTDIRLKGTGYMGSTLLLQNEILLNFVFANATIGSAAYAEVSYVHHDGAAVHVTIPAEDFGVYGTAGQYVTVPGLKMADYEQVVTLTLYDAAGNELSVCQDSVEAYVARMTGADPVYDAVIKLGKSSYDYFH